MVSISPDNSMRAWSVSEACPSVCPPFLPVSSADVFAEALPEAGVLPLSVMSAADWLLLSAAEGVSTSPGREEGAPLSCVACEGEEFSCPDWEALPQAARTAAHRRTAHRHPGILFVFLSCFFICFFPFLYVIRRIAAVKKQDIRFISKNLLKETVTIRTPGLLPEMGKEIGGGLGTGAELLGSKHGLQLFSGIEPCGNFFIGRGMVGKSSFSFQYYDVGGRIGKSYR